MAVDTDRVGILMDDGTGTQTIALLDRGSGAWTSAPIEKTQLPYVTDIAFMHDGFVGLMAPPSPPTAPNGPLDCAVVTISPQGLTLAPRRFPMLDQYAPRFASIPGPDVCYLGRSPDGEPYPRRLLPLPYPAYVTNGALTRFALPGSDPDQVWHRLYAEAYLPQGTALTIWARAAQIQFGDLVAQAAQVAEQADLTLNQVAVTGNETAITAARVAVANALSNLQSVKALSRADQTTATAADQAALAAILAATPDVAFLDADNAAIVAKNNSLSPLTPTLRDALTIAPFHRQPPLTTVSQPSELPFHPGLAALAGAPGALYEVLLQRSVGANRRLTGGFLDIAAVAAGDGRHSPCLRAVRIYASRFSYQDEYLPTYFHQTQTSDESDLAAMASPPDFRERLLANFEGLLTPIESRVAAAEYLLDPKAAPASALSWLVSYFGRTLDSVMAGGAEPARARHDGSSVPPARHLPRRLPCPRHRHRRRGGARRNRGP